MRSAWTMWRTRERNLEERVRVLESQVYVLSSQLAQLNAVAMKKQFQRVKP